MKGSSQASSSESDGISSDIGEGGGTRKRRRNVKRSNYLQGECRKVYKLNESLNQSLLESDISIRCVCLFCVSCLAQIADGFKQLKHHGTELKKKGKKRRLQEPKDPDRDHYRNVSMQNEWIRGNLFDTMGNYLFCHKCIIKALNVSPQRLSRQRKVKRNQFQKPLVSMTKNEVYKEKVNHLFLCPSPL